MWYYTIGIAVSFVIIWFALLRDFINRFRTILAFIGAGTFLEKKTNNLDSFNK